MSITPDISQLEDFIRKYKIALKLKWTREQFAGFIGMQTDTVRRKLGKIKDSVGLQLPLLKLDNGDEKELTTDCIQKFTQEYNRALGKTSGVTKQSKRYVITAAQNATPIHQGFFDSIRMYCQHNDAELIIIPYRYRNPTSVWTKNNEEDDWWNAKLTPYIHDTELLLSKNLVVLANVKVQPTASEPVSGLESFTGTDSTIIGHPKIQFKSVPTLSGKPKILLSTGAITVPNYTDSKAGWKGTFHHSIGAVIVEIDNNEIFHVRHIHASGPTGQFYDLDKLYTTTKVVGGQRAAALITGDTHAEFIDETVENVTFHQLDSIANVMNPEMFIFHDLTDFYARNHHHRGNDIIAVGKHRHGLNNVEDGLQAAADFIDRVSRKGTRNYVVKSNHDEAFDRWLREADIRGDAENAQFYYYMKYNQMKHIVRTGTGFDSFDPLEFWCKHPENGLGLRNLESTTFLKRDESLLVKNVEIGFHGDVGINGARGDIKSLARLSDKMIIGHSHSPGIHEGCYQVGLSAMKNLEYKRGPSSWMHTHAIIYPDGKRTLINIINGRWKAD